MACSLRNRQQTKTKQNASLVSSLTSTTCEMSCTGIRRNAPISRELLLVFRDSAEGGFPHLSFPPEAEWRPKVVTLPIQLLYCKLKRLRFVRCVQTPFSRRHQKCIHSIRNPPHPSPVGLLVTQAVGILYLLHWSKLDWGERDHPLMTDSTWAALRESLA